MKFLLEALLIIGALIILVYCFFYLMPKALSPTSPMPGGSVCIKGHCFLVQVAQTNAQREKGLMNRTQLDKDKGMLFIFSKESIYPFWMKNTLIPLDMIWISSDRKIVFIANDVQPCKTLICPQQNPATAAKYVLEVNAGISDQAGFKIGDQVDIVLQ